MFGNWLGEYRKLSEKWRFVSKLAAFLISVALLFSFYQSIEFYFSDRYSLVPSEEFEFLLYNLFQFAIFIVFASRFFLLFFKSKKTFWIAQSLSIIGLILISVYFYISMPGENSFTFSDTHPFDLFIYSNRQFGFYGVSYLILSPLKLLVISIVAFFKSK